jgi:hypothetical protein
MVLGGVWPVKSCSDAARRQPAQSTPDRTCSSGTDGPGLAPVRPWTTDRLGAVRPLLRAGDAVCFHVRRRPLPVATVLCSWKRLPRLLVLPDSRRLAPASRSAARTGTTRLRSGPAKARWSRGRRLRCCRKAGLPLAIVQVDLLGPSPRRRTAKGRSRGGGCIVRKRWAWSKEGTAGRPRHAGLLPYPSTFRATDGWTRGRR